VRHETQKIEAARVVAAAEIPVWGAPEGLDERPYYRVVEGVVAALNQRITSFPGQAGEPLKPTPAHGHLVNRAVQLGLCERPRSTKASDVIATLAKVYAANREWVRVELQAWAEGVAEAAESEAEEDEQRFHEADTTEPRREREPGEEG